MSKHVAFWIGVFAAGLVIMPIALGIWAVAQGFAQDIAVSLFIIIAVLVFLLVVFLFLRGPILRRLVGRGEATLEEVSSSLISGVSAAVRGDIARAEAEADALARAALGWYAWSSFYRWVIATALGLLLAFASFTGTVLLFEQLAKLERQTDVMDDQRELMAAQTAFMESQTARIEEQTAQAAMQNEIMTLNLVNELRNQLLGSVETFPLVDILKGIGASDVEQPLFRFASDRKSCQLGFDPSHMMQLPPSAATIGAIANLAQEGDLSARVVDALTLLVSDRNGGVALGALLALKQAGRPVPEGEIRLRKVAVIEPVFLNEHRYKLVLEASYLANLFCIDCSVHLVGSFLFKRSPMTLSGHSNAVVDVRVSDPLNGITTTEKSWEPPNDVSAFPLETSQFLYDGYNTYLTGLEVDDACIEMGKIARINPLLMLMPSQ